MAHYAKVRDGKVVEVIVAEPEFFITFVDDTPGRWVKTSYNIRAGVYFNGKEPAADQSVITGDEARERKNFAGIGMNYDGVGFYEDQPFPSWTLNQTSYIWEAPLTYPNDGLFYKWDEELYQSDNTKGWVEITND
jgi:hypothetical protein